MDTVGHIVLYKPVSENAIKPILKRTALIPVML